MHDLVIRGGMVVDGTGAPARPADVAIEGDRIVAVEAPGECGAARRELDARGLLVTPGFVDLHTHYDAQATWDPALTPSSWHGVTTVVMGSCGVGFAPAAPDRHAWLIGLMEGVEDIPGSALSEGIRWGWESFPEYLDALEGMPRALDVGAQVPHGALRAYVMGDRGARNDPATADDVARMGALVREALEAGALGFSTSRTLLHKALDGVHVPGTFAAREELFGIGHAMAAAGHGVFQVASDHAQVPAELAWMRELARETGRTVMFNLSQVDPAPELWRAGLALLEAARAEGLPLFAQVAGRAIGIIMTLDGTAHPLVPYPTYRALAALPLAERVARLRDPAVRARLLAEQPLSLGAFEDFIARSFPRMFLPEPDGTLDYEPGPEKSVAAAAGREGRAPLEVALDALLAGGGTGLLYFPLFNYAKGDLSPLHELHRHPGTLLGLSDAGAHCGAICDGGVPTFMLSHWTRDRARGPRLPLELIVRRQTRDTAAAFGLHDRGVLAPGFRADVNLIDAARLALRPVELVRDLPAQGRRLLQRATGYVATLVAGTPILEHDELTGATPGRLLRGPQPAPVLAATAS